MNLGMREWKIPVWLCSSCQVGRTLAITTLHFSFFLALSQFYVFPYSMRWSQEQGCNYKCWKQGWLLSKKAVIICRNLNVRIPNDLIGWVAPSPYMAKLELTGNMAILPGGKNSPLVLHLCNFTCIMGADWRGGTCESSGAAAIKPGTMGKPIILLKGRKL